MNSRRFLPRIALMLLLVATAGWAAFHSDQINLAAIDSWLGRRGPWAPIAHVALFALATLAFVPGVVFSLVGGALFGPFWGTLWNLLGATLGAIFAFLVARYVAGQWVQRRVGGILERLLDSSDVEGWRFVAFVRLVPLFPFNLSNYMLGLTRIPLSHYALTTLVCMVPAAVAYTWLGYAGRGALAGDADTVRYGLFALGFLATVALLPRVVRARRSFAWIEPNELKRRIDSSVQISVVDVRSPGEFTGPLGHIASAQNIPLAQLKDRMAELASCEANQLVIVCRTHKRSANAARILRAAGFSDVSVLRRGMEQWKKANLPVQGQATNEL